MRSGAPLRRTRLSGMSAGTRAEAGRRTDVRMETLARSGGRCSIAHLIPEIPYCVGGIPDVDEIEGRGVNPGGHLDPTNTQTACRAHHQWKTEHPKEAVERGLTVRSGYERRLNEGETLLKQKWL